MLLYSGMLKGTLTLSWQIDQPIQLDEKTVLMVTLNILGSKVKHFKLLQMLKLFLS